MLLENKTALITGGGSGIGRASAIRLAKEGANIVVADVNITGGEETAALVADGGRSAIFVSCDVSKAGEVEAMVSAAVKAFGGFDIALNNAGVGGSLVNLHDLDEATWDRVININLKGVWLCMKYEIPAMLARGGGSIINVSSVAGLVGFRSNAVYAASKHGVIGLTKSAALEYARQGIRVNAICPGYTETPMVTHLIEEVPFMAEGTRKSSPMRRLGRVEEIADAVLYLASGLSSFVNGVALPLDGGTAAQ